MIDIEQTAIEFGRRLLDCPKKEFKCEKEIEVSTSFLPKASIKCGCKLKTK